MKRTVVLLILTVVFSVVLGSATAHAGGWFKTTTSDTVGDSYWKDGSPETNATDTVTPHLGFSTTSNQCRVCHAIHLAGDESYRLLKAGTNSETRTSGELTFTPENPAVSNTGMGNRRSTECMYCHDADSGASSSRPYDLSIGTTKTVRGEHSLGATWIPDSSVNDTVTPGDGRGVLPRKEAGAIDSVLDCYQCHSVHGAKILTNITGFGWGEIEPIDNYILRDDPAGNGGDANTGIDSILAPWDSSDSTNKWVNDQSKDTSSYPSLDTTAYLLSSIWKYEVQAAWCGDCHNENPNITGPGDFRPNNRSHPLFGGKDSSDTESITQGGWMTINGVFQKVSGAAPKGCAQCHLSGTGADSTSALSWPHQGEGNKFLGYNSPDHTATGGTFEAFAEGSKSGPGDSNRVVPNMDKACLWCHKYENDTEGVGITF